MDYKKIIDQLTNEVLTYIQKAIQKAPADKSFRTKILDNLGDGKYKVRYKGKDYTVKANSSGLIVGTWVTVCALQNNWNELYILGTENGNSSSSELDSEHINDTSIHTNSTEKSKWNQAYSHSNSAHAPSNAQENVIEAIEVNGSAVEVSDKTVNITVPTKTSELILDNIEEGANKYVHPDSGVAAGTYKQVVVNAQGHITSGSNPTTLSGYGITDAEAKGTASSLISTHNSSTTAHSDIRDLISGLETRLNTLADSDDETLDQMSEIVAYIKNNKSLIENITTSKVSVSDIVDNLTTNVSNKPLSAAQGVVLKELIDSLQEELNNNTDKINEELDGHIDDTTIHITSDERVNWNDSNDKKHTHSNKSVLDGITSTLVSTWNTASNKLDKTGDASNVINTITTATTRENLTTGEKLSVSLGKISKWFTDLKTVALTGSYNDLTDKPTIGTGTITVKQAGTTKGTFTVNQTDNTTIELTDNNTTYSTGNTSTSGLTKLYTSTGTNTDGTMTQSAIKSALDGKSDTSHTHDGRYYTETEIDTKLSTKSNTGHTHSNSEITSLDASKITSGTISIDRLPKGALERCVVVADDAARFALTTSSVQTGDTVKVSGTGIMYFVADDSKLSSESGYEVYTAGSATNVPWSGITDKPSSYTPSSHTQSISTITGLQAALDSKATIEQGDKADTAVQSVKIGTVEYKSGTNVVLPNYPTTLPASDVYSWAKAATKPTYTKSEVGLGNVDNTADADKSVKYATNSGTLTGLTATVSELNYVDGVTSNIQTQLNDKSSANHSHNLSTMINTLSTGTSAPTDGDYYVAQYAGGGTTTTTYHRKPVSALWVYIKSKLAAVATSGSYNDLSDKPTIPTVGNGTITITQGGTTKGTFTTNQSGNTTIALTDTNTTYSAATQSAQGLMSSSDKTKLDGIATGAQVNQNAFSNVVVGSTTVAADNTTDTLTLVGSNVTLTPDATNDKVTIGITKANVTSALGYTPPTTNTTYNTATSSTNGLMSSTDKAKLDGITSSADAVSFTQSLTNGTKVGTITINGTGTDLYAPTNTDTHYTTGLKVGASSTATTNATASNGSVYLNVLDNSTVRDSHKITGSGATTVTSDSSGNITISSTNTNTTYSAGTGLSLSGTTFNHSNSVTAGTASGDSSKTLTFGGTFTIPTVAYDAQGHITGKGTTTMTMPANPNTDTHYTSKNVVGSTTATSNTTSALTNGNVYLNSVENSKVTSTHKISGSGATTVTTDSSGNIIISSTDTNTDTVTTTTTTGSGNAVTSITASNGKLTVAKDSTFLTAHPPISKGTDTTSSVSPSAGNTFTAIDSITKDTNGHITAINTKTVTLPSTNIVVDDSLSNTSNNPVQNKVIYSALLKKSDTDHTHDGLMTSTEKDKLDGIETGAQVNTITGVKGDAETSYRTGKVNITKENIGLSDVENKSSLTIRNEITKDNVVSALGYEPIQGKAATIEDVTIPVSSFVLQEDGIYLYSLNNEQVNADSIIDVYFSKDCQKIGAKAGITVTSEEGIIHFHATKQPQGTLFIETMRIINPTQDDSYNESYNTELALLQNPTFEDYSSTIYEEDFNVSMNKISSGGIFTKLFEGIKGSLLNLKKQIDNCNDDISSYNSEFENKLLETNEKFDDYLSLAGGTVTGRVIIKDDIFDIDKDLAKARIIVGNGDTENGDHYVDFCANGKETSNWVKIRLGAETGGEYYPIEKMARLIYYNGDNNAFYNLYGEHNYQNIKLGKSLNMFDGVNLRGNVIQCLDDGDSNNYGSELIIGGCGNTYIGAGESHTQLYKENGVSAGETLYLTSDNSIYFCANCNTIANRKVAVLAKDAFYPATNGGFTLGTSSLRWGQIYSTASSISTSDRNEKHDINPVNAETVENLIMGLNPVTYKYDNGTSDRLHYGLIAQDVEELLNELNIPSKDFAAFIKSQKEHFDEKSGETTPVTDENGEPVYTYGLRYEEFVAPLIKMVQMQQKQITALEERIEKLEKLLENM